MVQHEEATATAKREGGVCLGSYRIDVMSRALPVLATAAFFTTLGALGICSTFVGHGAVHRWHEPLTYAGAFFMLVGPPLGFVGMRVLLADDEYLAAFERGLLVHAVSLDAFVPWSAVKRVAREEAALVVELEEHETVRFTGSFAGIDHATLAGRVEDYRRKASFDLLRV